MKHSSLVGGSTVARVLECPGSVELIKSMPVATDKGSDFANEGSMLHEIMPMILQSGDSSADLIGFEAYGHTFNIDHECEAILPALEAWSFLAKKFNIEAFDCEVMADWGPVLPGAFGSIDLIGSGMTHNMVLDWKMGAGVRVTAHGNKQGRFYSAGAMLDPSLDDIFNPELPTVIAIVQPRVEDGTTFEVVEPGELRAFIQTVKSAVTIAQQPDAPLKTGKHCRWCNAKVICPEKLGLVENLPTIDSDKLSEYLDVAEQASDWAKAVHALAHSEVENGHHVPGWKLVAKRATRKWADLAAAEAALRGPGYRQQVKFICERVLRSPAQVEKILKKSGKVLPDGIVVKSSSGGTLVREDDKRPAMLSVAKSLSDLGKRVA